MGWKFQTILHWDKPVTIITRKRISDSSLKKTNYILVRVLDFLYISDRVRFTVYLVTVLDSPKYYCLEQNSDRTIHAK